MVEHGDVMPSLWCRDNVYAMYMQGYDNVVPPQDQFVSSYDMLMELAKDYEVPPQQVFETIGINKVLDLLQKRKLSSWFLIASPTFHSFMNSRPVHEKAILEESVQVGAMVMRIQSDPKLMNMFMEFRQAAKEMNV
jgi:hypothetical protein